MVNRMYIDLMVFRSSNNKLAKCDEQRKEIAGACANRASATGVVGGSTKITHVEKTEENGKVVQNYSFTVRLEKVKFRSETIAEKHLEIGRKFVERAAESRGWTVKGDSKDEQEKIAAQENRPAFQVPELTDEVKKEFFSGLHERDAHMRLIWRSFKTYEETKGEERNHILLFGDAASAKSSVIMGFKNWLDSVDNVERVLHINATTLSKAGLEKLLLEKSQVGLMPEIIFVNEIEKADSNDLLCLLSIMDGIGKISRLNAKIGKQEAKCSPVIIADCNDAAKIQNAQSGAIWSRFTKKLPCTRPSKTVMTNILYDAIEKRKQKGYPSNRAWVPCIIKYGFEVKKNNDPRFLKSLIEGGDDLLNGKYFKDLEDVERLHEIAEQAKMSMKG